MQSHAPLLLVTFPSTWTYFTSSVHCVCFLLRAFPAEFLKSRALLFWEGIPWVCSAGRAAEGRMNEPAHLLLPAQPQTHCAAELLTVKSKGYFTTDYKDLKPEQMSGCLTAKYSPLAQPPVLPSIFLIWQDRRLQPHLIPFLCVSFL